MLPSSFRTFLRKIRVAPIAAVVLLAALPASAAVTVSPANVSASVDTAANATSPSYTALGNIVITEGAGADFANGQTNATLVLNAPSGWQFNPAQGSVGVANPNNFNGAPTIGVTASAATVTFSINGTNKTDVMTISGLQVRPADGTTTTSGNIVATGSYSIAGISGTTNFGTLTINRPGAAKKLAITTQPTGAVAGQNFGTQPIVTVQDQFGATITSSSAQITAAIGSGTSTLLGTKVINAASGVATYTDLHYNKAESITVSFSSAGLTSATSNSFTITPDTATQLAFITQPGNATAGSVFGTQPVVKTVDQFGNPSTVGLPSSNPVAVALASGTGTLQGITNFDVGTNWGDGQLFLTDLRIDTAGPKTIAFTGFGSGVTSNSFTVSPAAASQIVFTTQPGDGTAGSTLSTQPVVQTQDAFGNVSAVGLGATANLSLVASSGTLQGTSSINVGTGGTNGVATFTNLRIDAAGTKQLTASVGALTPVASSSFNINAANASVLAFSVQPGNGTAGSILSTQPTVVTKDAFGNTTTNGLAANLTVTMSIAGGTGSLLGTATGDIGTAASNGSLAFTDLEIDSAGAKTLQAAASGFTSGTSSSFTIAPTTATVIAFATQPGGATAGAAFTTQPVIKTRDQYGNDSTVGLPGGAIPLSIALTTGSGTLQGTTSYDIASGSVTATGLRIDAAGSKQLTASATGFSDVVSSSFTVAAANATKLVYTTQPGSATAGAVFGTQPVIKSRDQFDNDSTGGLGASKVVTIAIQSGSGTLQGTATFDIGTAAGNGTATFTNLRIDAAGAKVLRASVASGLTLADSNSFMVAPATATKLVYTTQPAGATAGANFTTQPVVQSQDQFNNPSAAGLGASAPVTMTISTGTGTLQGTATIDIGTGAATPGVATFTDLRIDTAGVKQLTAATAGLTSAVSNNLTVNPGAATNLVFTVQPGGATAGSAFGTQPVVKSRDAFGNDSTVGLGASKSVAMTIASGGGSLQGTATIDIGTAAGNGTATFTNLRIDQAGAKTLQAAASGLTTATSNSFTVAASAATKLVYTTQPGGATAGAVFATQPALQTQDAFNNPSNVGVGASKVVTVTLTTGTGALQGTATADIGTGAGNGNVTFTNLRIDAAGAKQLTAAASGLTSAVSNSFTVNAAAASVLVFTTQPGNGTAGSTLSTQPVVVSRDAFGNPSTAGIGANSMVALTISSGNGTLQGTSSVDIGTAAGNGTATFSGLRIDEAGSKQLTATAPFASVASNTFTIAPTTASKLTFTQQPGGATAGAAFATQPVVKSQDVFGNDSTVGLANNQNLTIAIVGGGTLQGTTTINIGNNGPTPGTVTFSGLRIDAAGAKVLRATASGLTQADSASFNVSPAATSTLVVTAPASTVAGIGITATVTANDAFGNTTPAYAGTVHITSNDGQAVLPSDSTLTAGVGTFPVTLKTAGSRSVVATDTVSSGINGSTSVTVNPAAAASLTFGSVPASVTAGSAFTMSLTARDAFNNVATGYSGTVAFTKTDSAATVPANYTFTGGDAGVHSFTNGFNLKTAGSQTITATDAGHSLAITTSSITVNPAATSTYAITGAPVSITAGTQFSITVTSKDQFGNTTPSYGGTVHFTSNDGAAVLPGNSTLTSGTGTFNVTLKTSGARTVVATDTVTGSINATANVTVNPAAASTLAVTAPASSTAGSSFSVTVTAKDSFGNTTTSYAGTVHLSSTDGQAILAGDSTLTSGTKTYSGVTLKTAGGQSITAADTVDGTITGSANVTVAAAAASQLVFTTQPGNATAGGIFGTQPVVKSQDAFGNDSTVGLSNNQSVTIARTSGSGTLQGTTSVAFGLHASVPGVATFTDLRIDDASDAKQLTASTGGLTNGVSNSFTVSPAATSTYALTMPASSTAGNQFNVTVTAKDAFGNTTPAYSGTVHITSNDGQAVLPADNTLTSGAGIFAVTLKTAGTKSVAATDTVSASITKSQNVTVSAAAPATVNKTAGDGATLAADASETATVQVIDGFGNNVPSTNVAFAITGGNGKANGSSSANVSTNASGIASVTWTMGPVAGANTMTATAGTASATFNATGTCTYTTKASGDWNTPSTWVGECVPTAGDAATIASGHTITVSTTAQAASLTFAAASADTTLSLSGAATLTVGGAVTFNVPAANQTTETLAVGAGTLSAGSITLNGSGGQKVTQVTVSTGTINVSGSMTFPGNPPTQKLTATGAAHINIGGDFNTGGTLTLDPTSTTTFNGTVAQTIGTYNPNNYFGNVVIANTSAPVTAAGALGAAGTFTINSGATFNASSVNLTLLGNLVDNGTFTAGSGTVAANGTSAQTFSGSASPINFNSLTVNNAAGLTISTPVTVSGALNLTAGIVSTGSMSITLGSAATTSRGTGYVNGNLAKTYAAAASKTFEVGTANGYSPATVNVTAGSFPATMLVKATQGAHPNAPGSDSLKRYWTLSGSGITGADLTFNYLAGDVVGTESAYSVGRFVSGNVWNYPAGSVDAVNHVGTATGVTAFGDFTLNERASKLSVTSVNGGTSPVAGAAFDVNVSSVDGNGNPVAVSANTTVSLSVTTGTGTLGGTVSGNINAGSSSVTISGLTYAKAETGVVLTAAATAGDTLTSAASAPFDVVAGPLDHFLVESSTGGNIAPQAAGTPFNVRITAQDAFNNTVTGFTGTVALTSNATMTGAPLTTANFTAGVLATQAITITSAQANVTISANESETGKNGTSNAFTVNPGGAATFLVEAGSGGNIAPQIAGNAFAVRITVKDSFGNVVPSFTGTVDLTSNAGTVSPLNVVFGAGDNGVKTANVTLTQSNAAATLTGTSGQTTGTSNAFVVSSAGAANFLVEAGSGGSIAPQTAGTAFSIRLTARDGFGNTATGYTGSVTLSTNAGTIAPAPVIFAGADNGVKVVSVTVTQSGAGKTITATDSSSNSGTSNAFTVNAGSLDHFLVEAAAGGSIPAQTADAAFAIKVTALDANGNVVTGFNGAGNTVDITSSGTLSQGAGTTAAFSNGVLASHNVAISNGGSFTITATKTGGTAAGTSNSFTVTVTGTDIAVTGNGPSTLLPGSIGVYNLTVTNNGPAAATGVSLALTLPAGWSVTAADAPCAGGFPCAIGSMPASSSKAIAVQVSVPFGAGANTPFAVVASATSTTLDPINTNNSATVQTTVPIVTCPTPVARATPQQGTTSVPLNGTLTWIGGNADSYTVYLGPQGTGCSNVYSTTTATSFNYTGLQPNTTYEWRIVANRPGCAPVSSSCGTFTTGAACGDTPALVASAVSEIRSGSTYHVYWNGAGTSYELQESTTSDFATPTSQVGLASGVAFSHNVTTQTAFYYRVRFISPCHPVDERVWSETVRVVVQPPQSETDSSFDIPVENGSSQPVGQIVQLTAPAGKDALATTVIGDRSWLTLTPAGGASQPNGVRYLVTVNPAGLPEGTSTGTLRLVDGSGNTLGSASISVQSLLPLETRGKASTANNAVVILGVAHADGFNSRWQSDIRIYNPASSPTQYDLFFTPSRVDGTKTGRHSSVTVPARETVALDDVVRHVFGYGVMGNESATGALEIRPRQNDGTPALVSSRTYNVTPAGTFGQFVPGVAIPQFAGNDTTLSLQQVAHSAAYRTNFGLVEGSGNTTDVVVRIFDDAGTKRAEVPVTLQPFEHRQIDGLLGANNLQLDDARIEVNVTSPNGRVAAYASVVDNRSNDPLLVTGVNPKKVVADRYIVPGVADYTTPAARWLTDLRIYNPNAASATASVVFMGDGGTTVTKSVTIAPGEVKAYNSVVSSLFGKENIGGVVHVLVAPSMSLVVTARTYDGKGAGTYGQFIPAVTASEGAALGSPALQLLQVEQSARYRANIGFTEVAGKTAKVQIDAVAADGRTGSMTIDLAAYEYRQLGSLLRALNLDDAYNARITIRVIGGNGRIVSYASVIDNQTQDPTYIPAQ